MSWPIVIRLESLYTDAFCHYVYMACYKKKQLFNSTNSFQLDVSGLWISPEISWPLFKSLHILRNHVRGVKAQLMITTVYNSGHFWAKKVLFSKVSYVGGDSCILCEYYYTPMIYILLPAPYTISTILSCVGYLCILYFYNSCVSGCLVKLCRFRLSFLVDW